jgi:hypothetical protein
MLQSALATAANPARVEFHAGIDHDDPALQEYRELLHRTPTHLHTYRPRVRPSVMWQQLYAKASGGILMLCNDDVLFRTKGWDERIEAEFQKYADRLLLCWTNDLEPAARGKANHWFVSREWCEALGFFCWEGDCGGRGALEYFGNDDVPWMVAQAVGRAVYLKDVHVEHMHAKYGKAPKDATYTEPRKANPTSRDEPRLRALGPQVEAWAAKVRGAMREAKREAA